VPPLDPRALVGQVLEGRYRVDQLLRDRPHAALLRAQHLTLGTPVALEILRVAPLSLPERAELLARLHDDARVIHALSRSTPVVVPALEIFHLDLPGGAFAPCLVREWIDAPTLEEARVAGQLRARLLRAAPAPGDRLSAAEIVGALAPLVEALRCAHAAGVAHLGLAPSSVLIVDQHPLLKLLDFGIAKHLPITSPAYAAPEQIDPRLGAPGPWTDVFALALLVVELLVGRRALGDGSAAECAKRALDPATRPTPQGLGVMMPDAIEAALRSALAVDPSARPRTADLFWKELALASGAVGEVPLFSNQPTAPVEAAVRAAVVVEETPREGGRGALYALIALVLGVLGVIAGIKWKDDILAASPWAPPSAHPSAAPSQSASPSGSASGVPSSKASASASAKGSAGCPAGMRLVAPRVCLDELEVTVGAYHAGEAVAAIGRRTKKTGDRGACTSSAGAPVNCVSLEQARAYCKSVQKRLPTAAEWRAAAREWTTRDDHPYEPLEAPDYDVEAKPSECTQSGICGLAGHLSELVEKGERTPCVLGPSWDTRFVADWLTTCRPLPWTAATDAGSSVGFRCAADVR
jgi:serine/threonine-protein kinase